MTAAKPLRADARRNRDALIAAARGVFESGDYELRFDDFARLAGVGTGTLYRHFPTREALAAAVYQDEVAVLCDRARRLQSTLSPAEALTTFLRDMVDHMVAHEGLARTLAALPAARSEELVEGGLALEHAVGELVDAAVEAGTVRADLRAGTVMMVLHGIGASHDRPGWRTEAADVLTLMIDGMRG